MQEPFSNFAEVRFIDRDRIVEDLRRAVAEAKLAHPEIARVLLFGSLAQGNWTADSDADLIVVARREFAGIPERSRYQIHVDSIETDTLVYSETEFERLKRGPLAEDLRFAEEL